MAKSGFIRPETNFNNIIKESIKEIKDTGRCFCFNEEQANEIKKAYNGNLKAIEDIDGIFTLTVN